MRASDAVRVGRVTRTRTHRALETREPTRASTCRARTSRRGGGRVGVEKKKNAENMCTTTFIPRSRESRSEITLQYAVRFARRRPSSRARRVTPFFDEPVERRADPNNTPTARTS